MSWMDSWSRPSKSTQFPPPLYLTNTNVPYCHTCGRVISSRRDKVSNASSTHNASPVKYCSERCRRSKPGRIDRQIEDAFAALLHGDLEAYKKKYGKDGEESGESGKLKKAKGDSRLIVWCSDVETLVFGSRYDPEKTAGRRRNRVPRGVPNGPEWKSVDMEDRGSSDGIDSEDELSDSRDNEQFETKNGVKLALDSQIDKDHRFFMAGKKRPDQALSEVNYSVGGERGWAEKIEETDEMLQKRREGQKKAEERELVRKAARRGVAFGFRVERDKVVKFEGVTKGKKKGGRKERAGAESTAEEDLEEQKEARRKCEAVITKAAVVVEPSFAKGDWGVRWRDDEQVR